LSSPDTRTAAFDEVFGDLTALVAGPGSKRADELVLIDEADLEGKQSKEDVAVCADGGRGGLQSMASFPPYNRTQHRTGALSRGKRRIESIMAYTDGPCIPDGHRFVPAWPFPPLCPETDPFRCQIDQPLRHCKVRRGRSRGVVRAGGRFSWQSVASAVR
jgi:hypothetical protein